MLVSTGKCIHRASDWFAIPLSISLHGMEKPICGIGSAIGILESAGGQDETELDQDELEPSVDMERGGEIHEVGDASGRKVIFKSQHQ